MLIYGAEDYGEADIEEGVITSLLDCQAASLNLEMSLENK